MTSNIPRCIYSIRNHEPDKNIQKWIQLKFVLYLFIIDVSDHIF